MYIDVMAGYASCDGDKLYISFISVIFTVTHFSDKGNDKNTTQNIPKNVISSEEIHFSRKGLGMSQTPPPVATVPALTSYTCSLPSRWNPPLCPPEFQADLCHCTKAKHQLKQ